MNEYIIESRTLFESAPLTVTLEMWTDQDTDYRDFDCSPEDIAAFEAGSRQYVMLRAVVTVDAGQPGMHEMIIGEDNISGVDHDALSHSTAKCDAFEMIGGWTEGDVTHMGSTAWSVVGDAVDKADALCTALQADSDALAEVEEWVDAFSVAARTAHTVSS